MKGFLSLLILLLALLASFKCEKLGELDLIDFEKIVSNKYLTEESTVFVAVSEQEKIQETHQTELNKLKSWIDESLVSVKTFAVSDSKFAKKFSLLKFPQVIFFRNGRFIQFKGEISFDPLKNWIENNQERVSKELNDASFEHDTQASTGSTTGDWFIMFSKNDCRTSQFIESAWELASKKLENRVLFAYVNFDENLKLQERFYLNESPTLMFFKGGRMYRYELKTFDVESFVSFATVTYKNIKAEKVPAEITWFDKFTDDVVTFLKKQKLEKHKNTAIVCSIAFLGLAVLFFIIYKIKSASRTPHQTKLSPKLD